MADYEGNGLAAFNDSRSRGWSGSVTLADLEKLSAGNPIMQGIAAVWPDAPPSRADQAYQTSIDRWKQLGKDAFFAPANGLKAFMDVPTLNNALGVMPMSGIGKMPINPPTGILSPRSAAVGDRLVGINAAAVDAAWKKDPSFYVGSNGAGESASPWKYQNIDRLISSGGNLHAPEFGVLSNGSVGFVDGRHRFAVMRDRGMQVIPVAMDETSITNASKFGYLDKVGAK